MHGLHCWSYGHHNLIINCSLLLITFLYMSELKKVKLKIKSLKKETLIIFFSFFISLSYCTLFQCSSIIKQSITKSFPHLSHQRLTLHFSSAKEVLYPSGPLHLLFSFRGMGHYCVINHPTWTKITLLYTFINLYSFFFFNKK
jgi:hypothetical protein